jgi:hypothetical protein
LGESRCGGSGHLVVLLDETPRDAHRARDLVSDK